MVVKYPALMIIGLIILAAGAGLSHYFRRLRGMKYDEGIRVANTELVRGLPEYRRMQFVYRVLSIVAEASLIGTVAASIILASRPYKTETIPNGVKKRDIFLCMDISYSIYQQNYDIADYLIEVVRGLEGDRFGICVFNTTSVVYVPMTDDYDFVIQKLEDLKEYFHLTREYVENFGDYNYISEIPEDQLDYFYELQEKLDYEEAGTLIDNRNRGSSLIGEGLASCLYSFPRLDDSDRTRVVILSTDNWEEARRNPTVELDEAADLCSAHDVKVYGVFPERTDLDPSTAMSYENMGEEMKQAVEKTGGLFYKAQNDFPVSSIVQSIQKEEAKQVEEIMMTRQVDQPRNIFIAMLVCLMISLVTGVVLRKW